MDFVDFNLAKKLKEKGFNLHCMPFYALENFIDECVDSCGDCYEVDFEKDILYLNYPLRYKKFEEKMLPAPTISQVLKWLRKEKEIDIAINPSIKYDDNLNRIRDYNCYIFAPRWNEPYCTDYYDSYEQAAMVGIKFALDNLI